MWQWLVGCVFVLLLSFPTQLRGADAPLLTLVAQPARVELTTHRQKLVFSQSDGRFVLSTFVQDGAQWRELFNARRPLVEGSQFDLQPSRYSIDVDTARRKAVTFFGSHREPDFEWKMRVDAEADSPLVHFLIMCHLSHPLTLDEAQPVVALWLRGGRVAFHLDQGPDSIYGSAGIPHGYGFPAAYLWDDRREAAVFFNMTPMHWMQPDGVARFHDVRVMTRSEADYTGLGLHFKRLSGSHLPAGDMTIEFYLHQGVRSDKPTGLQALDTMIGLFSPLHPADSAFPSNQLTGQPASWEMFARQATTDLMVNTQTVAEIVAPWRDSPLELVPGQENMIVHPGRVMDDAAQTQQNWDFSTVNNHLTPWLLLARLHDDEAAFRLALEKMNALPRFYDPRARLMRHGTRQPPHVGDLEMCWQNFFFHEETLRAATAAGADNFNPAVVGRFLLATGGLRELAHRVDFVFPQWFDPYQKQPVVQNDMQSLGIVREPWQVGAYAHLMMRAFEMTGRSEFLVEARCAVETLMERMDFQVQNEVYDRRYSEVAEFPVTELFGNAWGVAAAYRLYEETGDDKFLRYSRDFMNTLLRLTFWYEDETDPVSRELRNAGLFYPHCGAHVATPWETSETHLIIAWTLKHDRTHPLTDLLLTLSNLNRLNSFCFFPATWTEPVRALDGADRPELGQYFPIEPFYCLEGTGGHRGPTAAYMAGLALWNAWLYEALAEASDRSVMVLNLDALEDYDEALSGSERHFVVYNNSPVERIFRLHVKHLPDGQYLTTIGTREEVRSGTELREGLLLSLQSREHERVSLVARDHHERRARGEQTQAAQNALAHAYQVLQDAATESPAAAPFEPHVQGFRQALRAYRAGNLDQAIADARKLIETIEGAGLSRQ